MNLHHAPPGTIRYELYKCAAKYVPIEGKMETMTLSRLQKFATGKYRLSMET